MRHPLSAPVAVSEGLEPANSCHTCLSRRLLPDIHHQARSRCQVDDLRDRGRVTVAGDVALFALILQHKDDGCDPTSFGYRNRALPSPDPRRYREHPAYGVRKPPHNGPARMAMTEPTTLLLGRLRSLFLIAVCRPDTSSPLIRSSPNDGRTKARCRAARPNPVQT